MSDESIHPIPLPPQYAAEIIRSDGDRSLVFVDHGKRRIETEQHGHRSVVIGRPDLGVLYNLNEAGREVLTIDWRNIVIGPPDPTVFDIPAGFVQRTIGQHQSYGEASETDSS